MVTGERHSSRDAVGSRDGHVKGSVCLLCSKGKYNARRQASYWPELHSVPSFCHFVCCPPGYSQHPLSSSVQKKKKAVTCRNKNYHWSLIQNILKLLLIRKKKIPRQEAISLNMCISEHKGIEKDTSEVSSFSFLFIFFSASSFFSLFLIKGKKKLIF